MKFKWRRRKLWRSKEKYWKTSAVDIRECVFTRKISLVLASCCHSNVKPFHVWRPLMHALMSYPNKIFKKNSSTDFFFKRVKKGKKNFYWVVKRKSIPREDASKFFCNEKCSSRKWQKERNQGERNHSKIRL
jgi:hypothetical protein